MNINVERIRPLRSLSSVDKNSLTTVIDAEGDALAPGGTREFDVWAAVKLIYTHKCIVAVYFYVSKDTEDGLAYLGSLAARTTSVAP